MGALRNSLLGRTGEGKQESQRSSTKTKGMKDKQEFQVKFKGMKIYKQTAKITDCVPFHIWLFLI